MLQCLGPTWPQGGSLETILAQSWRVLRLCWIHGGGQEFEHEVQRGASSYFWSAPAATSL
eukprot:6093529-Karenia_brevis.AAC.1